MRCPTCNGPMLGPLGDSAFEDRWAFECDDVACGTEVSRPAAYGKGTMAKLCGCGGQCGDGPCPREPAQHPQQQMSLTDQFLALRTLANRWGYYDAADYIGERFGERGQARGR